MSKLTLILGCVNRYLILVTLYLVNAYQVPGYHLTYMFYVIAEGISVRNEKREFVLVLFFTWF